MAEQETSPTSSGRNTRPFLTEGIILALSSFVAYSIARSYELGFADYFGFPHWMVSLDFPTVLVAWTGLLGSLALWYLLAFSFLVVVPARTARVAFLVSWTTICFLTAGIMALALPSPSWFRWFALPILAGAAIVGYINIIYPLRRFTGSRLDRWEASLAERRDASRQLGKPPSVFEGSFSWPWLGVALFIAYLGVLVIPVGLGVVKFFGELRAGSGCDYAIAQDGTTDLTLRRYGDNVVLARLTVDSVIDTTSFRLAPIEALANRPWAHICLPIRQHATGG
jgi:hypothetical protein